MFANSCAIRTMATGGRFAAAVAACLFLRGSVVLAEQATSAVRVAEEHGVFTVVARFHVDQPAPVVLNVLTDYEQIPRFMPDVRKSVVRERAAGRAVVEQEAQSGFMLFSKRVHLVLEIEEQPAALIFRDRCRTSFVRYEGAWRIAQEEGQTEVVYQLTAEPSFDVPGFVLQRLLRRNSTQMIEGLRREIESRADLSTNRVR